MINIRAVEEKDLSRLAEIYAEVYAVVDIGETWTKDSAHTFLAYWFKRQPDLFFVAEDGDALVGGFVAGIRPWCRGNLLVDGEVFVLPDCQHKKVATRLFEAVISGAINKHNIVALSGLTFIGMDFPLSWYKKLGMGEMKEWVVVSGDPKKVLENLRASLKNST